MLGKSLIVVNINGFYNRQVNHCNYNRLLNILCGGRGVKKP